MAADIAIAVVTRRLDAFRLFGHSVLSGWSIGQSIHCVCGQEVVGEVVVVGVGILNSNNEVGGGLLMKTLVT